MPTPTSYFTSGGDPLDIDALMAFHKARYGGFKMEDEPPTDALPADEPPADEPPTDEPPTDEPPVDEPPVDDDKDKLSHEDALEALKAARADAAKQRHKAKAAQEKLEAAKTPEEFEAAREEILEEAAKDARDLLIENVALKHNLPPKLAERLRGETREELEADAKELLEFAQPIDDDDSPGPSGGLDPNDSNSAAHDPVKAVADLRSRNRRF